MRGPREDNLRLRLRSQRYSDRNALHSPYGLSILTRMRASGHKPMRRGSAQDRKKLAARSAPTTGKRAVALAIRKALMRAPRVNTALAELLKASRHFKANRHLFR